MESEVKEISINGICYVPKGSANSLAATLDGFKYVTGMKYVICRTRSAGVFAGYLETRTGQEVVLRQARRIWYWDGAASLSQLAEERTSNPGKCKFPKAVNRVELLHAIEIIDCTEQARKSIQGVKIWKR